MPSTRGNCRVAWALAVACLSATFAIANTPGEIVVSPPVVVPESQKLPVYPPAAFAARFGGTVTVEAVVLKNGTVGDVKILACSRPSLGFEDAAIAAVKKWKFDPAHRGDETVDYPLKFRLSFSNGGAQVGPRVSAGSYSEGDTPARTAVNSPSSTSSAKPN